MFLKSKVQNNSIALEIKSYKYIWKTKKNGVSDSFPLKSGVSCEYLFDSPRLGCICSLYYVNRL